MLILREGGELFRADEAYVTDGLSTLHTGVHPEERIREAIEQMLRLVQSDEVPALYSALASHYIFEYIHPFYDGNGRTGRYLLSLFLEEPLSKPTALSLSRSMAENKSRYYHAFQTAENPLNHGELTFFVETMLDLILQSQEELISRFEDNARCFALICEQQQALEERAREDGLGEKELAIVFGLAQQAAFGMFADMPLERLAEHIGLGKQQARKYLARLEQKGVVQRVRKRSPLTFALTEEFRARAFPETPKGGA